MTYPAGAAGPSSASSPGIEQGPERLEGTRLSTPRDFLTLKLGKSLRRGAGPWLVSAVVDHYNHHQDGQIRTYTILRSTWSPALEMFRQGPIERTDSAELASAQFNVWLMQIWCDCLKSRSFTEF